MINQLLRRIVPSYQGIAPVLIGFLFALTLLCNLFNHLHFTQSFPDLVAGYVAYWGVDKTQDARAFVLLMAMLVILPMLIASISRYVAPQGHRFGVGRAAHQLLLFSLIPVAWRLAVDCSMPVDGLPQFNTVCLFPGLALIALLLLSRYRSQLKPEHILTTGGAIILIIFLSIFVGFALAVFLIRVIPATYPLLAGHGTALACASVVVSITVIIASLVFSPTIDLFQERILGWLRLLQYPLVLFFFHMVPPPFVDPQHRFSEVYPTGLVLTLTVWVGGCWFYIHRRFQTSAAADLKPLHHHPLVRALAPAAIAGLIVYVYCGTAGLPQMNGDDFHWGEQILPWQQLVTFHKIPYVDFVPIHGLMSYVRGAFTSLFWNGTAASYEASNILFMGIAAATLAFTACRIVTPLGALYLLGGALPMHDQIYFYIPALLAISAPQLVAKPVRLLTAWLIISALMFGYTPTQGPAFTIASFPVAIWASWRAWHEQRAGLIRIVLLLLTLAVLGLVISPVRLIALAFVRFVAENGYTNVVAHGIPWSQGRHMRGPLMGPGSTQFLWEMTREFWIILAFICAGVFWKNAFGNKSRNVSLLILTSATPIYLLVWSPWSLGRIAPGGFDYQGDISHTCIYWLLPVVVFLSVNPRRLVPALLTLAVFLGFFYPDNPTIVDPIPLLEKCVVARVVPADTQVTDGTAIGMPRIGKVVTPIELIYLQPIKAFLDSILKPGETYLDFTNRTALYYYMNLPFPVRYVSFMAANTRMQAGILKQLDDHPVVAVLLAPAIMMDMISPNLREYYVYRHYATTYSMVTSNVYGFLVEPKRGATLSPPAIPVGSDGHAAALDSRTYFSEDLREIPASWGASFKTLQGLFTHVVDVDPAAVAFTHDLKLTPHNAMIPTGPNPYFEFAVPPQAASGKVADFLLIHFAFDPKPLHSSDPPPTDPKFRFYFVSRSVGEYSRPFNFDAPAGDLLIPLGSYPRWLLANDLMTIRFDLLNPQCANSFRFAKMEFLHLKDPPMN